MSKTKPEKLKRKTLPAGHTVDDFECFGPPATTDGEFDGPMLCDMGCFNQDKKRNDDPTKLIDSNKFYHAAIVLSKIDDLYYVYLQWGREGTEGDWQFVKCGTLEDAKAFFAKQLHSKNDKRGEWSEKNGVRILVAKSGKDVYKVRQLAKREWGLPGAATIGAVAKKVIKSKKKGKKVNIDDQTSELLQALNVATVSFTKSAMQGGTLPTQAAIDEGRQILNAAKIRLTEIKGSDLNAQVKDKDLRQLSFEMYSRIPKIKTSKDEAAWILSQTNVVGWEQDLSAYEGGLDASDAEIVEDPFGGMPVTMEWLAPDDPAGLFVREWMPKATRNKNPELRQLRIINVWRVSREGDADRLMAVQEKSIVGGSYATPPNGPACRLDLDEKARHRASQSNTCLQFHGTRSVNVAGILRKGLKLPDKLTGVVLTGAMLGPGIYGADDFKKAANYTSFPNAWYTKGQGGVSGRGGFIFIKDMVLGNPFVAPHPQGYLEPPAGHHSVQGKAGFTSSWNKSSRLVGNEWVVYDHDRVNLRYLVEFEEGAKW